MPSLTSWPKHIFGEFQISVLIFAHSFKKGLGFFVAAYFSKE